MESTVMSGVFSVIFGIGIIAWIVSIIVPLVIFALIIAARWKILEKAGEDGWKALIPFYSDYMLYSICWSGKMYFIPILSVFLGICSLFVGGALQAEGVLASIFGILFIVLVYIVPGIIYIVFWRKLAASFGRGVLFTLGLLFLHPIFIMILGFDSSDYEG